jgi:hypothetical protein
MGMARVRSKSGSGENRLRKARAAKRRSAKKRKESASRHKPKLARTANPITTDRLGRSIAEQGSPIQVQARLKEMLQVEMRNLDKVEALLRCLSLAMDQVDMSDAGTPWFPDVVEVAADLAWRSNMDLQDLGDEERIVHPLLAKLKDPW